jgi:DNA-directed RNA polymerase specialized sigma24 family protein
MEKNELNQLVSRKRQGEENLGGEILERIARDVYARPQLYGLRSEDDVGEIFEHYWTRIAGLVERYEDIGSTFEAYLISTVRYMALSLRRKKACAADREAIFVDHSKAEMASNAGAISSRRFPTRKKLSAAGFPARSDQRPQAMVFRRRMLFLCIKCANLLDDGDAMLIASSVGLDQKVLFENLDKARAQGLGLRQRTASRRRGRDSAWLRMGAASRRLARETDSQVRRSIEERIEHDRGLYARAISKLSKSAPVISNKAVAELLGIPKGTVDCGVSRILKQCSILYSGDVIM